jgi:hypothetical protein
MQLGFDFLSVLREPQRSCRSKAFTAKVAEGFGKIAKRIVFAILALLTESDLYNSPHA